MSFFGKLIAARMPSAAIGLTGESASVVQLERRRDSLSVRRAGYVPLPEGLLRPDFDGPNIGDPNEFASALSQLATGAGLGKRRRWSVALPEAATRTAILTMESSPVSRNEGEEMLRWKTERAVGAPLAELRVSRERLPPDAQGRARYLVAAIRLSVLAEYEATFDALGWHAGLILPRHMGEAWWLMRGAAAASDSLLVSSYAEGFTAVILREGQPLFVRSVLCSVEDRADELYRFLLFYRDRTSPEGDDAADGSASAPDETIGSMLVAGDRFDYEQASAIVEETLSVPPRSLRPEDVRLAFPASEIDFQQIAAPAGLAALAFA